jgi:hypothetical protein
LTGAARPPLIAIVCIFIMSYCAVGLSTTITNRRWSYHQAVAL